MKLLTVPCSLMLSALLAAAPMLAPAPPPVSAAAQDAATPAADASQPPGRPQPGTLQEMRHYEQRQAQSPEVQDFTGGALGLILVLLLIILIIVLVD